MQSAAATVSLLQALDALAPFGAGNPRPRFVLTAARILKADIVGENHIRCIVGGEGQGRLKAVAFRAVGDPLGAALLGARSLPVHLAGHLKLDRWQGREEAQFVIEDLAPIA
jgi:single-stranded-DNA-specific exonuclease